MDFMLVFRPLSKRHSAEGRPITKQLSENLVYHPIFPVTFQPLRGSVSANARGGVRIRAMPSKVIQYLLLPKEKKKSQQRKFWFRKNSTIRQIACVSLSFYVHNCIVIHAQQLHAVILALISPLARVSKTKEQFFVIFLFSRKSREWFYFIRFWLNR